MSPRHRVPTPQPSAPAAVIASIARMIKESPRADARCEVPVASGFPAVLLDGVAKTAANVDAGWIGFDVDSALSKTLKRPVTVLNDADAAGWQRCASARARTEKGTVLVITLGTGIGSALFNDGKLVPNLELGQMEIRGRPSRAAFRGASPEPVAGCRGRRGRAISTSTSTGRPRSCSAERVHPRRRRLQARRQVHPAADGPGAGRPATLQNDAGIVGAAMRPSRCRHGAPLAETAPSAATTTRTATSPPSATSPRVARPRKPDSRDARLAADLVLTRRIVRWRSPPRPDNARPCRTSHPELISSSARSCTSSSTWAPRWRSRSSAGAIAVRFGQPAIIGYLARGRRVGPFTPGFVGDIERIADPRRAGRRPAAVRPGRRVLAPASCARVRRVVVPGAILQILIVTVVGPRSAIPLGLRPPRGGGRRRGARDQLDARGHQGAHRARRARQPPRADRRRLDDPPGPRHDRVHGDAAAARRAATRSRRSSSRSSARRCSWRSPSSSATRALPWLFRVVARLGSRELFLLAVSRPRCSTAFISSALFGLSLALGAFVGGLLVSRVRPVASGRRRDPAVPRPVRGALLRLGGDAARPVGAPRRRPAARAARPDRRRGKALATRGPRAAARAARRAARSCSARRSPRSASSASCSRRARSGSESSTRAATTSSWARPSLRSCSSPSSCRDRRAARPGRSSARRPRHRRGGRAGAEAHRVGCAAARGASATSRRTRRTDRPAGSSSWVRAASGGSSSGRSAARGFACVVVDRDPGALDEVARLGRGDRCSATPRTPRSSRRAGLDGRACW